MLCIVRGLLLNYFQYGLQYRQAVGQNKQAMRKNASTRSFTAYGFGANRDRERANREETQSNSSGGNLPRRGSQITVNVAPTVPENDTPEIRKYKKRFNSDILCAALWGESLL